jgi:uncharacterized protein with HEPN domain
MERDDAYLLDMLSAAQEAAALAEGMSLDELRSNRVVQHALVRLLQVVGEAARHVSDEGRSRQPGISWRGVVGLRHRLVHDYSSINLAEVHRVLRDEVPKLISLLEPIVPSPDTPEQ